jgi:hypothetical protein
MRELCARLAECFVGPPQFGIALRALYRDAGDVSELTDQIFLDRRRRGGFTPVEGEDTDDL